MARGWTFDRRTLSWKKRSPNLMPLIVGSALFVTGIAVGYLSLRYLFPTPEIQKNEMQIQALKESVFQERQRLQTLQESLKVLALLERQTYHLMTSSQETTQESFSPMPAFSPKELVSETFLDSLALALERSLQMYRHQKAQLPWEELTNPSIPRGLPCTGQVVVPMDTLFNSFTQKKEFHSGIDIVAPEKSPVYATIQGTVTSIYQERRWATVVEIRSERGYVTRYAALATTPVRIGEKVAVGTLIGHITTPPLSQVPHLHYEIWYKGNPIDPTLTLWNVYSLSDYISLPQHLKATSPLE
ncbi:MAG: M23 family metallopeptidase [Bacteroidia bacterium]